jgi:hypothetical protein
MTDWIYDAFETLLCYLRWLADMGLFVIIGAVNLFFGAVAALINAAIAFLPDAAVERPTPDGSWLATINYFIPLGPISVQIGVLITAWIAYRIYRSIFGFLPG